VKEDRDTDYCDELIMVLDRLEKLHGELAEVIDRKIDRMRVCDVPGMNECLGREQDLVAQVGEKEGLRRVLTDRVGRSFGMSPQKARRLTATQMAERLPAPHGRRLRASAGRLQELARRIERRNRVAGRLSTDVLEHLDTVLSAVTAPPDRSSAYSFAGRSVATAPRRLFEAVG